MQLLPLYLYGAGRRRLADLPIFDVEDKNSFQAVMETNQALVERSSRSASFLNQAEKPLAGLDERGALGAAKRERSQPSVAVQGHEP
jgi:hypothetical protein